MCEREKESVCVRERESAFVCVCVCVSEGEGEREYQRSFEGNAVHPPLRRALPPPSGKPSTLSRGGVHLTTQQVMSKAREIMSTTRTLDDVRVANNLRQFSSAKRKA